MWRRARADNELWQTALLQSLPDYHRYDPKGAKRGLERAVSAHASGEVAVLARVRLAELTDSEVCRTLGKELQHRLDKVIAIEKKLDDDAR